MHLNLLCGLHCVHDRFHGMCDMCGRSCSVRGALGHLQGDCGECASAKVSISFMPRLRGSTFLRPTTTAMRAIASDPPPPPRLPQGCMGMVCGKR